MERPLYLASRSPRRATLLREAGIDATVIPSGIDDADLTPGDVSPEGWVTALAHLKARAGRDRLRESGKAERGTIIAADTVCVHDGAILGQPVDESDARRMLHAMRSATHRTITGVALLSVRGDQRLIFHDGSIVHVGDVPDEAIETYLASGEWRGKAGGYNLIERVEAGWPVRCEGDPTTVMGLPMDRLLPLLEEAAKVSDVRR